MDHLVKARDWNEIISFYEDMTKRNSRFEKLLNLVNHINDNDLSKRLYAYTSVYYLIISIYNQIVINKETLTISPNGKDGLWNFKYNPQPYAKPEHERQYDGDLIKHFTNYIQMLKW